VRFNCRSLCRSPFERSGFGGFRARNDRVGPQSHGPRTPRRSPDRPRLSHLHRHHLQSRLDLARPDLLRLGLTGFRALFEHRRRPALRCKRKRARGRKRATRDPRKSRIKPSMLKGYGPRMSQKGPARGTPEPQSAETPMPPFGTPTDFWRSTGRTEAFAGEGVEVIASHECRYPAPLRDRARESPELPPSPDVRPLSLALAR
jgi:hypothetical protein